MATPLASHAAASSFVQAKEMIDDETELRIGEGETPRCLLSGARAARSAGPCRWNVSAGTAVC